MRLTVKLDLPIPSQTVSTKVALVPNQVAAYQKAIEAAGGEVVPIAPDVLALVWTDYGDPVGLANTLSANPQLKWVQLPFAGVDAFAHLLKQPLLFTSAKRSYSEPVAEHALTLALALGRTLPARIRATSWGENFADSLFDENVLIIGGGGITEVLVNLLQPFRAKISVVRKRTSEPFPGGALVVGFDEFEHYLGKAKFVFIACALTDETRFLFNKERFNLMRSDAYLVNVARGEVVNQEALVAALLNGIIAGAATDVTYPEPLPDEHPMWKVPNLIITPHTADTPAIITELFAKRLRENVAAWLTNKPLVGVVDPNLGY